MYRRVVRRSRAFLASKTGKRLKRFGRAAVFPVVARYAPKMAYAYGMRALARNVAREEAAATAAYFGGTRDALIRRRFGNWNGA